MLLSSLLSTLLAVSFAGGANAQEIAKKLEAHYHDARTLEAVFLERYIEGGYLTHVESGTVYFSRPGRMRWEYESPQQKLFLVDGKNVWLYVPADRTATRQSVKKSEDWRTPLALLTGNAKLGELCGSVELASANPMHPEDRPNAPGDSVLRCLPHVRKGEKPPFREVLLETNAEFQLVRVLIRQPGSQDIEFQFGDWKENIRLPETKFHFFPPPGVAIIEASHLAGAQVR